MGSLIVFAATIMFADHCAEDGQSARLTNLIVDA